MNRQNLHMKIKLESYLQMEDATDEKSEFHDGIIVPRQENSYGHSLACIAVGAALFEALGGSGCQALQVGVKVWIEAANSMVYPDLMVVCGEPEFWLSRRDVICNPRVVVEVVSPETEGFDRGEKFQKYKMLGSLREYVLVEQDSANVDVFYLNGAGQWVNDSYSGLEGEMVLRSLGVRVAMRDVYRDLVL